MSHPIAVPRHPDHDHPWAMQLVLYRNRAEPADHFEVLAAAGCAVVQLLADPRVTDPNGAWASAVAHWRAGWIRKVTRRAENKRWDDVQTLAGVTVSSGTAQVRAMVPGPVAPLPRELNKLQVGGTEFPRHNVPTQNPAQQQTVVTVEMTPHATLSTGKAAAQVGHAAQLAYERLTQDAAAGDQAATNVLAAWRADGFRLTVSEPAAAHWDAADRPVRVMDAGLTEVQGVTETARAFWQTVTGISPPPGL